MKKIVVIGVGLIGGSVAISLKRNGFAGEIIGVERDNRNASYALNMGIIDRLMSMEEAVLYGDIILLAIPVEYIKELLPYIMNRMRIDSVVVDFGSTKYDICKIADKMKNRFQYVATHPMAGTEHSGPSNAYAGMFVNKKVIICDKEK